MNSHFPGGGNDNPLQYSFLGNPMDRGAWWATVHAVTKELDMTEYIKKQRHYFANKGPSSQGYGFSSGHVWM